MKVVRGDLVKLALDGRFEVIIRGCNCQCAMGGGIAKTIKQVFPEAHDADKATAKGSRTKLGSNPLSPTSLAARICRCTDTPRSQRSKPLVERGDRQIATVNGYIHWRDWRGLAMGDWSIIASIIEEELAGEDHTLVEYQRHL